MIIQSSNVRSGSSRTYRQTKANYSSLSLWNNTARTQSQTLLSNKQDLEENRKNITSFIADARQAYDKELEEKATDTNANATDSSDGVSNRADSMNRLYQHFQSIQNVHKNGLDEKVKQIKQIQEETLNYLLSILFGERYKPTQTITNLEENAETQEVTADSANNSENSNNSSDTISEHTGGRYYSYSSFYEKEVTGFGAKGTVVTADGRNIDFNINVTMSRSFYESSATEINFGEAQLKDPLVINLDSNIASVSDQKFFFDIDADGSSEEISMLSSGSGYLALDRNEDGIINDGSELFGTSSGNGFSDLAEYDEDGNGWIDEADSIFDKLKVWCMDEDGVSQLFSLRESGVGAIYLGTENTEFSLNSDSNVTNAVIRQTGIFLYENGDVGTIQQMDLAT